ncbi:hypothetical protein [Streptomyces griseocarneus]|uniref:hypothetical protein n=1 Tax=Streptomyces griseocarneus TaxID=51201 RepID=UPI00167CA9EB|nr:hypothetical protein [Streptomyces griseocarneus]MBZ6475733.1 hypothetical protein [Streptomyces griseocarneus]GHG51088.1 hypothetical protein GCM10018779_11750 [Streptomyces griseocarneus]
MTQRTAITVGEPEVRPDKASHVHGVRQGNHKGLYKRQPGHESDDRSSSRRSTGINPGPKNPILPGMPNLSPA